MLGEMLDWWWWMWETDEDSERKLRGENIESHVESLSFCVGSYCTESLRSRLMEYSRLANTTGDSR
jgi:hypothetical protein